jgi:dopamine beta-monooxygenase
VDFESAAPFTCAGISEADVKSTTYRFPSTEVPTEETNYWCKYFPLDVATAEHIIAYEPVIDNVEVMHHIIVYGCKSPVAITDSAQDCSDGMTECSEIVMLWTVGVSGSCYPQTYGALIGGEEGYTGFWMEHHWNNPQKTAGLYDSSGIKFYHTTNRRDNVAAYILWGPDFFSLEPNQETVTTQGKCPASQTSQMVREKMYITEMVPHMHYLGRNLVVKHTRPGEFEDRVLLTEDNYSYDSPQTYTIDPPIEFERGDELEVVCTYTTAGMTDTVSYGPATADEMCYIVAQVYD